MERYEDPNDRLNGPEHHSGKPCITKGCMKPAGTGWSPHWCFQHNKERMTRISKNLNDIAKDYGITS